MGFYLLKPMNLKFQLMNNDSCLLVWLINFVSREKTVGNEDKESKFENRLPLAEIKQIQNCLNKKDCKTTWRKPQK